MLALQASSATRLSGARCVTWSRSTAPGRHLYWRAAELAALWQSLQQQCCMGKGRRAGRPRQSGAWPQHWEGTCAVCAEDCDEQRARILSAHLTCAKIVALSGATWAVLLLWRPQVYCSIGQLTTAAGDVSPLKHMYIYACARLVAVIS